MKSLFAIFAICAILVSLMFFVLASAQTLQATPVPVGGSTSTIASGAAPGSATTITPQGTLTPGAFPTATASQPASTPEGKITATGTITATSTYTTPTMTPTPLPAFIPPPRVVAHNLTSHLINSAIILIIGGILAYLATRATYILLSHIHIGVRVFATRLVGFGAWIGIILAILTEFQVQVATITAIIGSVGLALSLSSQDLLKNFIAGVYILLERPFVVGDEITLGSYTGRVEFVDLRTTKLRTSHGEEVIVPNTIIMSQVVTRNSIPSIGLQVTPAEDQEDQVE
ncbi:MAG TPA: mechanosensitive ion channel domain-containing protein [Anaerolineales bacterium]|jgi:small-conductance mechanosensitive channel|nr:mechanosensitive ion channel domain-containing protein [Anaerolineales bacterium]